MTISTDQMNLRTWVLDKQFQRWVTTDHGQAVKAEVIKRARDLRESGFKSYGIEGIWNAMRYDRDKALGPDPSGFKLNNNWKRRLSRLIESECEDLREFFTKRNVGSENV